MGGAVKELLKHGANTEAVDLKYRRTALIVAAENDHTGIVTLLLKAGAKKDATDEDNETALILAAKAGHTAVVKVLLEHGANVEVKDKWDGNTPLMLAVMGGHEGVVTALLGAMEATTSWGGGLMSIGNTPLIEAAQNGYATIVKALLEAGVGMETLRSKDRKNALMVAVMYGHEAVVTLLLEKGANMEAFDNKGNTALSLAEERGRKAIVAALKKAGAPLTNPEAAKRVCEVAQHMADLKKCSIFLGMLPGKEAAAKKAADTAAATWKEVYCSFGAGITPVTNEAEKPAADAKRRLEGMRSGNAPALASAGHDMEQA